MEHPHQLTQIERNKDILPQWFKTFCLEDSFNWMFLEYKFFNMYEKVLTFFEVRITQEHFSFNKVMILYIMILIAS